MKLKPTISWSWIINKIEINAKNGKVFIIVTTTAESGIGFASFIRDRVVWFNTPTLQLNAQLLIIPHQPSTYHTTTLPPLILTLDKGLLI